MAFRLQSFAAGAAKRGSERLKSLEEDTKKLITNTTKHNKNSSISFSRTRIGR